MKKSKLNQIKLGNRVLNQFSKPYIIAEIGVNHEGSINNAKEMIQKAKEGGADAVKFQSYKAEKLASKYSPAYWDTNKEKTTSQYQLFKKYDHFNKNNYIDLSSYCKTINIDFSSTPFDLEAVDYLDPLVPYYKISSSDITNLPLLKKVARKKKPILLSTGASNIKEIEFARNTIMELGCKQIILMHCILNYPTKNNNANLRMLRGIKKKFPDNLIGYSDHTLPNIVDNPIIIAWMLGAVVIEKHFTNNKSLNGNDHYHSMDFNDLKKTIRSIDNIYEMLGDSDEKVVIESEKISRLNARRSIFMANNLKYGDVIKEKDIIAKRPGIGLSPLHWDKVIGKKIKSDISEDQLLNFDDIE